MNSKLYTPLIHQIQDKINTLVGSGITYKEMRRKNEIQIWFLRHNPFDRNSMFEGYIKL